MSRHDTGTVRMGPIGIFALVVALCVAVMSVLALASANASLALAERQASFTRDGYANEAAGQAFVAAVDETAAGVRASGGDGPAACDAVRDRMGDLLAEAGAGVVAATAEVDGDEVTARFSCESGRCLDIVLIIGDDATVSVASWKATTLWDEDTGDVLWTGVGSDSGAGGQ